MRVNLPVALLMIWVANPLTFAPILYAEYQLGNYLLGITPGRNSAWAHPGANSANCWPEPGVRCGSVQSSADCCSPFWVMA